MSTEPNLNDLAPYPLRYEEVTAEGLAKAIAVRAQADKARLDHMTVTSGLEWDAVIFAITKGYANTLLLRGLIEHAPKHADEVARTLWAEWQDGTGLAEWLAEWLGDWCISVEAINDIVAARFAQEPKP
jgi:hypothetical protein